MAAKGHFDMTEQEWVDLNKSVTASIPRWEPFLLVMMVIGVIGLVVGAVVGQGRVVQSLWFNFLFWGGIAQAAVTFSAIYHLFRGGWGPTMIRLGMVQTAYTLVLPVLYILIFFLFGPSTFPWANAAKYEAYHHLEGFGFKAFWLNTWFLLFRDLGILILLALLNLKFMATVTRVERGGLAELRKTTLPPGWEGLGIERERARVSGTKWAIALVMGYAFGYSVIGMDLIMALEPMWYSTMFGGYFFVTCLYMALASIVLWSVALRKPLGVTHLIGSTQFHDIGKLLLAFTVLSGYTCFAQYLPIWYGDLPEETEYILIRRDHPVYGAMGHFIFWGGFVALLIVLVNQKVKKVPATIALIAIWVLIIGITERHLLILPPLRSPEPTSIFTGVFGPVELLVTIGFAGLYIFTVLQGLRRAVIVPGPWKVSPVAF